MKQLLLLLPLLAAAFVAAQDDLPEHVEDVRVTPVVRAVRRVLPTVVNIGTERIVYRRNQDPFEEFYRRYFGLQGHGRQVLRPSLGSGVIVDDDGLFLTNNHVIQRASRINIYLADERMLEAEVVAMDVKNDLALLRVTGLEDGEELAAIDFAVPDDLLLGETVITVGNPFGFGHSVAVGVLSATRRRAVRDGEVLFDDILQTDAPINPGNSGGPLVNAAGELVGINLAMRQDAQGIGFAIPLKRIEDLLGVWLIPSRFGLNSCGLVPGTELNAEGRPRVVVRDVFAGSPAARAGLKAGDSIVAFNGAPVRQAIDVSRQLWSLQAGDNVRLELAGGTEIAFAVARMERLNGEELARQKLQVELQELNPTLARALRLPYERGLVVSEVPESSILARRGVQRGDVIIQIGEVPVFNFVSLYRALSAVHRGDVVEMVVDRVEHGSDYVISRYTLAVPF